MEDLVTEIREKSTEEVATEQTKKGVLNSISHARTRIDLIRRLREEANNIESLLQTDQDVSRVLA